MSKIGNAAGISIFGNDIHPTRVMCWRSCDSVRLNALPSWFVMFMVMLSSHLLRSQLVVASNVSLKLCRLGLGRHFDI